MLGVWCVLARCSVSSDHCAHSGLRPGFKTDNMLNPRAARLGLHSCTVWSDDAVVEYLSKSCNISDCREVDKSLTDDIHIWCIIAHLTYITFIIIKTQLWHHQSSWLKPCSFKSRFPHKLFIFVNDSKCSGELHHSHKFMRILITCVG